VNRINQVVKTVRVPSHSLLAKYKPQDGTKEYKDAYSIELPRRFKLVQGTGSNQQISVEDVAGAFFTCRVFSSFEKPLLKQLTDTDDKLIHYKAFRYKPGDQVLVWTVAEREVNEILFKWEYKGLKGTTWLALPFQENVIVFGSSFPSPAALESPKIDDFLASSPKKLFIDGSRNLPDVVPLGLKVRNFFLKQIYQISVPIHRLYSKYLLHSTYTRILQEKEEMIDD